MLVMPLPMDWPVLDWVRAEHDNFGLFRDRSDESDLLADAVCDQLSRWHPGRLARLRLLDYGAAPGSRLAALLRARVGSYTPVPLGGDADAAQYLAGLALGGPRPSYDAVLLSHVLPYIRRPDRVLSALARYAEPQAVAIAVGLAPHGDQHDLALHARRYDADYPRRHDHAVHLERWLSGHGVPRTARIVWSQARAEDRQTLRRLVEFMLGSVDAGLVDRVLATVPVGADGSAVVRTAHTVLAWPLRYHRVDDAAARTTGVAPGTGRLLTDARQPPRSTLRAGGSRA